MAKPKLCLLYELIKVAALLKLFRATPISGWRPIAHDGAEYNVQSVPDTGGLIDHLDACGFQPNNGIPVPTGHLIVFLHPVTRWAVAIKG
jgi:hypothetical protein